MKNVLELKIGEKAIVKDLDRESTVRRKLLEMGITPGVELLLSGKAPLGDPVEITIRGYKLTLRKNEAKGILI
ncbi:ferrous iron transport protein A [Clostridium sp. MSJ-4]|uniref:Ferrous iron transport protein A n=1 Tax=Clostridium simiarum TaxID=2841506 RepID=A0ABS6F186_9CLOT|nr:ferrous iron transport protein A [Clostridium simiarum]MBU5592266.1 ferrous iron transport protein A [Clostridium simiarum]